MLFVVVELTRGTCLEGKVPPGEKALSTFKEFFEIETKTVAVSPGLKRSDKEENTLDLVEPGTKKKRSMFDLVEFSSSAQLAGLDGRNEIEEYLQVNVKSENVDMEQFSLLGFWRDNEIKFPILSRMARKFLGIPASSGSVERLFSIAGAIARSRRASLTPNTIEKLLCCRQAFLNKSSQSNNRDC